MADFHDRRGSGQVYTYQPVGMDKFDPKPYAPAPGAPVRKSSQHGVKGGAAMASRNGFAYVEHAETGKFHGMVLKNSLQPKKKGKS